MTTPANPAESGSTSLGGEGESRFRREMLFGQRELVGAVANMPRRGAPLAEGLLVGDTIRGRWAPCLLQLTHGQGSARARARPRCGVCSGEAGERLSAFTRATWLLDQRELARPSAQLFDAPAGKSHAEG
jgi:hypothetical protein